MNLTRGPEKKRVSLEIINVIGVFQTLIKSIGTYLNSQNAILGDQKLSITSYR